MRKGEKTKLHILKTSVELAFEEGFESINFNQLAKKCGLSQPAFYKYFKNKNDLLYHCLLFCASNGREFIDKGNNPKDSAEMRLQSYIKGNLNWARSFPEEAHILISMYSYAHRNPSIKETFNMITAAGLERIESLLLAGNREGAWKVSDPVSASSLIQSVIMGEIIKRFNNEKFKTADSLYISMILKIIKA